MLFRKPIVVFIPLDFSENIIATSLIDDDLSSMTECYDGVTGFFENGSGIIDPSDYEYDAPYSPDDGVLLDPDEDILES